MSNGHGGKRAGAGRPKGSRGQRTLVREKAIAEAGADAEYALGLFVQGMRGELGDSSVRLYCAREVMDRVWGRPTQRKIVDKAVVWEWTYGDGGDDGGSQGDSPPEATSPAATDQAKLREAESPSAGQALGQDDACQ